jgi:hypothetical protein
MRNFDLQIPYRKVFFQHAVLSKFLGLTLLSTVSVLTVKNGVFILQRQSEEKRCLTSIHPSGIVYPFISVARDTGQTLHAIRCILQGVGMYRERERERERERDPSL